MLNNWQDKIKRVISVTATISLVLSGFLPSGFVGSSPAHASDALWDFSDPNDYSVDWAKATVGANMAFRDVTFTAAADNLDSHGPTLDVIETDTPGRLLAGVGEWPAPYSVDYGANWTQDAPLPGGFEVFTNKFTKITSGANTGRIIGVGWVPGAPDTGGWSYSDDDGGAWTGHSTIAGSTRWTSTYYDPNLGWTFAGTNDTDNEIYISADDGATFTNDGSGIPPLQGDLNGALSVNDIIATSDGSTIYASSSKVNLADEQTTIFYTKDNGATWTEATMTGAIQKTYGLAIDTN